jgi:hypothetical protein
MLRILADCYLLLDDPPPYPERVGPSRFHVGKTGPFMITSHFVAVVHYVEVVPAHAPSPSQRRTACSDNPARDEEISDKEYGASPRPLA